MTTSISQAFNDIYYLRTHFLFLAKKYVIVFFKNQIFLSYVLTVAISIRKYLVTYLLTSNDVNKADLKKSDKFLGTTKWYKSKLRCVSDN